MLKKHRIFIAINLPQEFKRVAARYEEKYKELPAKWMNADSLHLTLSFIGDITDTQLGEVCLAVKEAVKDHQSFEINLDKIVYAPVGKKTPSMVWLVGEKSKELSMLKRDIEAELQESIDFKPEVRSLTPHITLARLRMMEFRAMDREELPELNEGVDMIFEVPSIEVMESEMKKGGPQYTVIESYALNF